MTTLITRAPRVVGPATDTPWGPSQHATEIAPGVVSHSTASHGGFHVHPNVLARWPMPLREYQPFCGRAGWFEEDEDWAIVALAMPSLFSPLDLYHATTTALGMIARAIKEDARTMSRSNAASVAAFLSTPKGVELTAEVEAWTKEAVARGMHTRGSASYGAGPSVERWYPIDPDRPILVCTYPQAARMPSIPGAPTRDELEAAYLPIGGTIREEPRTRR